ncbi:MAG: 6-bladed beta-propeller [Bacteroidales bacterium]
MKYLIFILLLFIISCSSNHKQRFVKDYPEPILLNMTDRVGGTPIYLNTLLSDFKLIQLEGAVGCYIKEASRIRFLEDKIYIFDNVQNALFMFNENGNFIKQIIQRGKGPGEAIDVVDFDIDRKNKRLLVLELIKKELLVYNLDGIFQFSLKNDFQSFYFSCLDSTTYAFYIGYFDPSFHNLHLTSEKGKPKVLLFPYPKDISSMIFQQSGGITNNPEGVLYCNACSNEIYQIDNEGNTYLKYKIDFGQNSWPEEQKFNFQEFLFTMSQLHLDYLQNNFKENNDALIFPFQSGNRVQRAFYVKKTAVLYHIKNNLVNDVFYNVLSSPRGVTENGSFISVLDPLVVKDKLLMELKNGIAIHMDPKLQTAIINSNEQNSNLILLLYSF